MEDIIIIAECTLLNYQTKAVVQIYSVKKLFLEISQKSQENTLTRDSFLTKLPASSCNFIKKEALAQVFSCEFCEISRKLFFIEHLCWLLLLYQRKKCFCKTIHSEINLKSKQNRITMFYSPYVATKSICFKMSKV